MGILGGMIGPIMAAAEVRAPANFLSYPLFTIMGISTGPRAAISAMADPDMPPKNMLATTVAMARPPRIRPTKMRENLTKPSVIFPLAINSPAKTKNGIQSNGKLSIPE